jgi:hypothetical protein
MTNKKEAERSLEALHDWQSEEGQTDASMITVALEASTNATLYLAEQQRIANLIAASALVPAGSKPGIDSWGIDSDAVLRSRLADQDTWELLLGANVAKREGLS